MTQRFPFKDDVDLQDEKLLRVADGTERSDGVNLGQLQDATGTGVADYETQSNIPVLTNELTTETYVFRVLNNTETALGEGSALVINGSSIPAANRDISRGVGAGRFEYFSFTLPSNILPNLQNNPRNVETDITFGTGANAVTVRVADEVSSHVGVVYDLSVESSSVTNSADIRLSGGDGSQDNVTIAGSGGNTVTRSENTITIAAPEDYITIPATGRTESVTITTGDVVRINTPIANAIDGLYLKLDGVDENITADAAGDASLVTSALSHLRLEPQ